LSYLFGAVILAATINLVAGLTTKPSVVVGCAVGVDTRQPWA
jgi:hypothetical protein